MHKFRITFLPRCPNSGNDLGNYVKVEDMLILKPAPSTDVEAVLDIIIKVAGEAISARMRYNTFGDTHKHTYSRFALGTAAWGGVGWRWVGMGT